MSKKDNKDEVIRQLFAEIEDLTKDRDLWRDIAGHLLMPHTCGREDGTELDNMCIRCAGIDQFRWLVRNER